MAGHSKWKNIQHRKGAQDAKRGKIFTKILKEITVAVKTGGGDDPESNPRLRAAISSAKGQNMPKDNIERAIKKASGSGADALQEINFEGYGPNGIAIFVECATDNNTRTVSNVRSYFNKHGGSLGKNGCLQFIFDQKAVFTLDNENINEEEFTLDLIDAGAEDVEFDTKTILITAALDAFGDISKKLTELGLTPKEAGAERIPVDFKRM